MNEDELFSKMVNTLLMTPYRDLAELYSIHEQMFYEDPASYTEMAAWYADYGQADEHKEMFVIMLSLYTKWSAQSSFSRSPS